MSTFVERPDLYAWARAQWERRGIRRVHLHGPTHLIAGPGNRALCGVSTPNWQDAGKASIGCERCRTATGLPDDVLNAL